MKKRAKLISLSFCIFSLICVFAYNQYSKLKYVDARSEHIDITRRDIIQIEQELKNTFNEREINTFSSTLIFLKDFLADNFDLSKKKNGITIGLGIKEESYSISIGFFDAYLFHTIQITFDIASDELTEITSSFFEITRYFPWGIELFSIGYTSHTDESNSELGGFFARMRSKDFQKILEKHGDLDIFQLKEIIIKEMSFIKYSEFN